MKVKLTTKAEASLQKKIEEELKNDKPEKTIASLETNDTETNKDNRESSE